jgi:hypothetical protein
VKDFKDWTIGELHDYCENRSCTGCLMRENDDCGPLHRMSGKVPRGWDMTPMRPRFTEQERLDAQTLVKMFPSYDKIFRSSTSDLEVYDARGKTVPANGEMFPSIGVGESYHLADIAGDPSPR